MVLAARHNASLRGGDGLWRGRTDLAFSFDLVDEAEATGGIAATAIGSTGRRADLRGSQCRGPPTWGRAPQAIR